MDNLLESPGGGYILPDGTAVALENVEGICRAFAALFKDDPEGLVAALCNCALEVHKAGLPGMVPAYLDRVLAAGASDDATSHSLLALGMALERAKDLEAAAGSYGRAMHLPERDDNTWYYLHNNYGYCLGQMGRFEEAVPHCLTAIRINPETHNTFKNLGIALEGLGRKEEAAGCYRKSSINNPEDERPRQHLADLLFEGDIGKVPDLKANDRMFHYTRGRVTALTGGEEGAEGGKRALPLDDFDGMYDYFMELFEGKTICVCFALSMIAWHRAWHGLPLDMKSAMDLIAVAGASAEAAHALALLGDNLALIGHAEPALAAFNRAEELIPPDDHHLQLRYHNRLGWCLTRLGRHSEAEPHYRKALQVNPWHGPAWHGLGIALLARGDAAGAERCIITADALQLEPPKRLPSPKSCRIVAPTRRED